MIVGESTRAQVGDLPAGLFWQEVDRVRVKGRHQPVTIHTVRVAERGVDLAALRSELQLWDEALAAWRAQDFVTCRSKLDQLQGQNANFSLYRLCAERVASFLHTPPSATWDGTTVLDAK